MRERALPPVCPSPPQRDENMFDSLEVQLLHPLIHTDSWWSAPVLSLHLPLSLALWFSMSLALLPPSLSLSVCMSPMGSLISAQRSLHQHPSLATGDPCGERERERETAFLSGVRGRLPPLSRPPFSFSLSDRTPPTVSGVFRTSVVLRVRTTRGLLNESHVRVFCYNQLWSIR